jgi:MATE family multidrug resistance protein
LTEAALDRPDWHRLVWRLAIPIILSNISVPLLGMVDTAVMGQLDAPYYIGAVAVGTLIFTYIYWGFGFLRMGTTGFTAQAFGAGDTAEMRATFQRGLILAGVISVAVLVLQYPILALGRWAIDAGPEVESLASTYFQIRVWGAPAALANYVVLGWLLGRQQVRLALLLQVFLNGLNVVLDLGFVLGLGWGVEGVAFGTVLAEYATAIVGLWLIARILRRLSGDAPRARILDTVQLRRMITVNGDIFIRTLCLITAVAYFTARGAEQSDVVLAANAILMQLFMLVSHGLDGFAHVAETLVGSAVGKRDRTHLRRAVTVTTIWSAVVAVVFALGYAVLGGPFIDLMTVSPEVRETAREFLPWMILMPLIGIWAFQFDGVFLGATRTKALRNGMILSLATLVAVNAVLMPLWGNHGLWLSLIAFMTIRSVILILRYPALVRDLTTD